MSMPRFSVQEQTPKGYKYSLAMRLLEDVAPTILSINNPLTRRVAAAYSWYVFLKTSNPGLCAKVCGQDFEDDYKKWGEQELEKIAKALSEYATKLLGEIVWMDKAEPVKPPKPPRIR